MKWLIISLGLLSSIRIVHAQVDTLTISSQVLAQHVEVYLYDSEPKRKVKPIAYLTDGKKALENGTLDLIKQLTAHHKIPPAYYVLVSTIDTQGIDHRNTYFFCNPNYYRFFQQELIPAVESHFKQTFTTQQRSLIGISFGGLNAAYFSAQTPLLFQNYGLLSPITYPCPSLIKDLTFSQNEHLKVFLSTGTHDAETYLEPLKQVYQTKQYQIKVHNTSGGHDFDNWHSQLELLLNFLLLP